MSAFRERLGATFGRDFRELVPCLPGPRLRFELGVGDARDAYLREARTRALALLRALVAPSAAPWVEITFFSLPDDPGSPGAASIERLRSWGIELAAGSTWEIERASVRERIFEGSEHDTEWYVRVEERWSGHVRWDDAALERLFEVLFGRHIPGALAEPVGELAPYRLLFLEPRLGVALYPYDHRGADLVAADARSLRPFYQQFEPWLLDHDRPRMARELGE